LLQPVADVLKNHLSTQRLKNPKMTYVGNVNARAMRTSELIATDLANNIAHSVRWHDATTVATELGCNLFLEMAPGHVLTDLAKENLPGVHALAVENDVLPRLLRLAKEEIAAGG
jgi:malonate decarboxylase epsilon subunit